MTEKRGFVVLDKANSAEVTMTGQRGRYADGEWITERVVCKSDPQSIWYAVATFAMRHQIPQGEVQITVEPYRPRKK